MTIEGYWVDPDHGYRTRVSPVVWHMVLDQGGDPLYGGFRTICGSFRLKYDGDAMQWDEGDNGPNTPQYVRTSTMCADCLAALPTAVDEIERIPKPFR